MYLRIVFDVVLSFGVKSFGLFLFEFLEILGCIYCVGFVPLGDSDRLKLVSHNINITD